MSQDSDDDWETADFDARIEEQSKIKAKIEEKSQKTQQQSSSGSQPQFFVDLEDGNYMNNPKTQNVTQQADNNPAQSAGRRKPVEVHVQAYPFKDIQSIRSYAEDPMKFDQLYIKTFGEFERFIESHGQKPPEILVNLLIIDVTLLESPFRAHNKWLLSALVKEEQFWTKLMNFIEGFFEEKWKDHTFMLKIDVHGFFKNLTFMLSNLIVENVFEEKIKSFYESIVDLMKRYPDNPHNNVDQIEKLLGVYQNSEDIREKYSVYPTLSDLNTDEPSAKLKKNHTKGKFDSIEHYLDNHLSFLRSEIFNEFRNCMSYLGSQQRGLKANEVLQDRNSNCFVYPKVRIHRSDDRDRLFQIKITISKMRNADFTNRFFSGQMLLLTSSVEMKDLIVAVVIKTKNEKQEVQVKIVRRENIENIYGRDLIMIEPSTFYFEPFHRVKDILQNLNEFNFPFQSQILKFEDDSAPPSYLKPEENHVYSYKKCEFDIVKQWPSEQELSLETKQVEAVKKALTTQFAVIQGPPGTGKTHIGVEILKILLENTKERISVITHTNNALDRFLISAQKQIAKFTVRLGAQSKNAEAIEDFQPKFELLPDMKTYAGKIKAIFMREIEKLDSEDEIFTKYCLMTEIMDEAFQLNKFFNINNNRVFGMTTSFAAKNTSLNHLLRSSIVIIEEASEILESHLVASLTKHTKHVVMLGDHQQLRPHCSKFAARKNFDVSLFERMIDNSYPYTKLDVQRRMRPEISDLVRLTTYLSLTDSEEVGKLPAVMKMSANLFCLVHNEPDSKFSPTDSSSKNDFEAEKCVELAIQLLKFGYSAHDVKILTCYDAQVKKIQDVLKEWKGRNVKVVTTDSYQGEESKIIILSLVKSSESGDLGFMSDANRICVMLSRAKIGFFIVGNIEMFARKSPIWKKVYEYLRSNKLIGPAFPMISQ